MRKYVIILIVLILLLLGGYFVADPDAGRSVMVELGLLESVSEEYILSGILEAETTILSSEAGGKVLDVFAVEGQEIELGESLIQLDSSIQELELAIGEARLSAAQAKLDLLLDTPRSVDLAVAEAMVQRALVLHAAAEQALKDTQENLPEGAAEERIRLAELEVQKAKVGLDAAQENLRSMQDGASPASVEVARAGVSAVQAEVSEIDNRLEKQEIFSPMNGIVLDLLLIRGEVAMPAQPILTLADLRALEVVIYLPESDFSLMQVGKRVAVYVDSFPNQVFEGTVTSISEQAEFTPRNVQTPEERIILVYAVRISIPNHQLTLKPGLPVDISLGVKP
jgi:HlyD family secretion protein